jgi:hypothetical protein
MNFKSFLVEQLLLEGGVALKADPIKQARARKLIPKIIDLVADKLNISKAELKAVGSAGHKPSDELSGDIDIVVTKVQPKQLEDAIMELNPKRHRVMAGINVYSFGYEDGAKTYQVDLMPIADPSLAWMYLAVDEDLKQGLKSAHRNELLFALAHYVDSDEPTEGTRERYILSLSNGLFRAKQTKSPKSKSYATKSRELVTADASEIVKLLLGKVKLAQVASFDKMLAFILSSKFEHPEVRDQVLKLAVEGMKTKGLKIPAKLAA